MTEPMRRFLLNRQIALEARRIAHAATKTCRSPHISEGKDYHDEHTRKCNALKAEIEALALNVKLAGLQPPEARPREPPPPLYEREAE